MKKYIIFLLILALALILAPAALADGAAFSVTVPTGLPIVVGADGTVTVASDAQIVNSGAGAVKLDAITVVPQNSWRLDDWGTDYSAVQVDSKRFAMTLGGKAVPGDGGVDVAEWPSIGAGGSMALPYDARLAVQTANLSETVARVVFTVSWADGEPAAEPEPVYAILYSDGELVFQNGDTPEAGRTVTATYSGVETAADVPWSAQLKTITTVTFNTEVKPISTAGWFKGTLITGVTHIENLDTSLVANMESMFERCQNITTLDLSSFNTANVTSMKNMFFMSESLEEVNVSGWDTSNVTTMYNMFSCCGELMSLDLSSWNTSSLEDMGEMFDECHALESIDFTGWDTSHVSSMSNTFYECRSLTLLDLSGFDTSNVTAMDRMFYDCRKLTTIYVSDKFTTASVTNSSRMFSSSTKLVGGNGTAYSKSHVDATYARIDKAGAPGYFTAKA